MTENDQISEDGNLSIGFIGYGKMATALKQGFVSAGIVRPEDIIVSRKEKSELTFSDGTRVASSNVEVVRGSSVVIVAVKPHVMDTVLSEVAHVVTPDQLIISIAVGITIASMQKLLGPHAKVVRVMPNTPALIGAGVSVYSSGRMVTPPDGAIVQRLFSAVGYCKQLPESKQSAVAALSGSGPAYFFLAIEAMAEGGMKMGLSRELSIKMAAETLQGAARMVLETGEEPSQLRENVSSPGGTTVAAIQALRNGGFVETIVMAMHAALHRADEIAKGI